MQNQRNMMGNMMGNMQTMLQQFQQFIADPLGSLARIRLNIPQEYAGNTQGAIQHLMDTGQMDQATYNRLQQMATQIQRNPMFQRFMGINGTGR